MARPSNRATILEQGLKVVHAQGFAGASVRDIVQAAGVPQGSFTNHFKSKEDFGLEVIDLAWSGLRSEIDRTLGGSAASPLKRLEAYIDAVIRRLDGDDLKTGNLLGNLAAEQPSKRIRRRLAELFAETESAIADCLKAAAQAGEISSDLDPDELAGVIVASLEGAALLTKTGRSAAPLKRVRRILFATVLRR